MNSLTFLLHSTSIPLVLNKNEQKYSLIIKKNSRPLFFFFFFFLFRYLSNGSDLSMWTFFSCKIIGYLFCAWLNDMNWKSVGIGNARTSTHKPDMDINEYCAFMSGRTHDPSLMEQTRYLTTHVSPPSSHNTATSIWIGWRPEDVFTKERHCVFYMLWHL